MKKTLIAKAAAAALAFAAFTGSTAATALAGTSFLVVDILPLKTGKTIEDAKSYFSAIEPILARHGMTRSDKVLKVEKILRGDLDAKVINFWNSDNPQQSFDRVFKDKEYLKHVKNRDSIFALDKADDHHLQT